MLVYLLKSGVCLAVFYGFYKLLLEKESIHTFKRYYLLASVVLAFIIPFITFTEYIEITMRNVPLVFSDAPITNTIIESEPINYIRIILWTIYGLGLLLFSIKFLKNLLQLLYKIKHNTKIKIDQFTNVLLQDLIVPHTFFYYIFLNKQKFETQQIPKEVLLHEETHAKQKHSLDVLFIEILHILFWFNPLIYFIKNSIKLNHEFLADNAVLKQGIASSTYQNILLAFSSPDNYRDASNFQLANAINYSSIKKRFTVMKTHTSKQAFWLRSFILLPLLAILIYSFSEKKIVEKPFIVQQNITANGVTGTMMKEYRDFINSFESSNRIIYPKYLRTVAIYDLMTEEQRNSVKKYPEDIVSNPSNIKPKMPTEAEFNSWRDSNKFAIWIDGKHVKNSELNNYKTSDIKYFANSFVHNNARSKKFPQPYQNHLYTQKEFEETYGKANLKTYVSEREKVINFIENHKIDYPLGYLELSESEQNEFDILYRIMLSAFEKLTEDEKKSVPKILSPTPSAKLYKLENGKFGKKIIVDNNFKKTQQKITQDIVQEYKKKYNELEVLKKTSPHYIHKTETEQEKMNALFLDLNNMHIMMSHSNREMVSRPEAPILPYTKLIRNGKIEYKKISELTEEDKKLLPPPPPPPIPMMPQSPSKELLETKKKFKEKGDAYGNAMQPYLNEGKGNISDLKAQHEEVMKLYYIYSKLAEKENVLPPASASKK